MAGDMFMKIDDIKGESSDEAGNGKHKDTIDVLSWSWGMSQSGSTHHGKGGGTGKVNVQDLSFTKYVDKSSPNLIKFCCSGEHFKTAQLTVRKAAGHKSGPIEYLTIKMEEIIVSSVSTGGGGGEERITEHVSLNFARFEVVYTGQKADGSPDAAIPAKFNIAGNHAPK